MNSGKVFFFSDNIYYSFLAYTYAYTRDDLRSTHLVFFSGKEKCQPKKIMHHAIDFMKWNNQKAKEESTINYKVLQFFRWFYYVLLALIWKPHLKIASKKNTISLFRSDSTVYRKNFLFFFMPPKTSSKIRWRLTGFNPFNSFTTSYAIDFSFLFFSYFRWERSHETCCS